MKTFEPAADRPLDRHPIDRTLTGPPLSSGEAALAATFSLLLKLTHAESRALVRLVKHEHVTRKELHRALSHDGNPISGTKIVDVIVCRLRKKLAAGGIEVINIRGQGYRLSQTSRETIRKLLAEYGQDVVAAATPPIDGARSRPAGQGRENGCECAA